jgi:hypothetical protein
VSFIVHQCATQRTERVLHITLNTHVTIIQKPSHSKFQAPKVPSSSTGEYEPSPGQGTHGATHLPGLAGFNRINEIIGECFSIINYCGARIMDFVDSRIGAGAANTAAAKRVRMSTAKRMSKINCLT